jgi:hypothetical protein
MYEALINIYEYYKLYGNSIFNIRLRKATKCECSYAIKQIRHLKRIDKYIKLIKLETKEIKRRKNNERV